MTYDLGITTHYTPKVSRRSIVGSALALAAFAKVAPVFAQTSTPASQAEGDADALEVLRAAGQRILNLDTFTFSLETTSGTSTVFPGVELVSVEGAVRRPMDLTATMNVKAFMQTMQLSAVMVDGDFYVQNPLSGGAWENMGQAPEIATMINPDWILMAAINLIQDANITSERDGQTLIEGYMDLSQTLSTLGSDTEQLQQFLASGPVDIAFWIDEADYITRAELYGPIFASETSDVEKRIELKNFNEPVEINPPAI